MDYCLPTAFQSPAGEQKEAACSAAHLEIDTDKMNNVWTHSCHVGMPLFALFRRKALRKSNPLPFPWHLIQWSLAGYDRGDPG